jgi:NTP pyrophosphatase (non-canonical NTP hydrolase)
MQLPILDYKYEDKEMFLNQQIGKLYEELVELKHSYEKKDDVNIIAETLDIIQVCISILNTFKYRLVVSLIRNHNNKLTRRRWKIIKKINFKIK